MTGVAIVTMIAAMLIIWGGCAASIMHARKVSKQRAE